MSIRQQYHPRHAIDDPGAYYEAAFQNYPRPLTVQLVGRSAILLTRPQFSFHEGVKETEYFEQFEDTTPLLLTFTHRGLRKYHDPIAGAAAVFGTKSLVRRVRDIKVWAAITYVSDSKVGPVLDGLGAVPVIRSDDYKKFDVFPSDTESGSVKDELIDRSEHHLKQPGGNILGVFPAGTKGGKKMREGVGLVLERLTNAAAIPIALVSDTEETGNFPRGLRIAFGEPILAEEGLSCLDYVRSIDERMSKAVESVL